MDLARPTAVRGPVLFLALARLAAICFSLAMAFVPMFSAEFNQSRSDNRATKSALFGNVVMSEVSP